jgi:hypothetical protein
MEKIDEPIYIWRLMSGANRDSGLLVRDEIDIFRKRRHCHSNFSAFFQTGTEV